jgi:hypothetical protein
MGVTGMAKSRQSNAVMTFMARNYFARFARRRRNEKLGVLEKSCQHTIFIISNFNGGHRNGKKSFWPAVSSQNGQIGTKPKFQNFKWPYLSQIKKVSWVFLHGLRILDILSEKEKKLSKNPPGNCSLLLALSKSQHWSDHHCEGQIFWIFFPPTGSPILP